MFVDERRAFLQDWQDEDTRGKVNELLKSKGLGQLRELGCFLADSLALELRPGKGLVLVALSDVPAERVLLVERSVLPFVPPLLFPRLPQDLPSFHCGCPLLLIPSRWIANREPMMRYLKVASNFFVGGVYTIGSMMSHSCSPNAERYVRADGASAVVTTFPISKGEEITISYTNLVILPPWLGGTVVRRIWLLWWRGFWCRCDRCLGVEASVYPKIRAMAHANADQKGIEERIGAALYAHRGNLVLNEALLKEFLIDRPTAIFQWTASATSLILVALQLALFWALVPAVVQSFLPSPGYLVVALFVLFLSGDFVLSMALAFGISFKEGGGAWRLTRAVGPWAVLLFLYMRARSRSQGPLELAPS